MTARNHPGYTLLSKPYSLPIAIVLLFLMVSGAGFYNWRHDYARDLRGALDSDKTAASLLSELLSEHQRATIGVLQSYANRVLFIDAVGRRDFQTTLHHLTQLVESNRKIDIVFVTDVKGMLWVSYPLENAPLNRDFSFRDWYKGVSRKWEPYVSGLYRRQIGAEEIAVATAVPVFDKNGKPIGILANPQSVSFLASIIRQVPFGRQTLVTILDGAGYIIYSNESSATGEARRHPLVPSIEKAVREGISSIEVGDPEGTGGAAHYATIIPMKDIGWTVMIERSRSDLLRASLERFVPAGSSYLIFFMLLALSLSYVKRTLELSETAELLGMEKKLREDEERFKELFEHMSSGVAVYEAVNGGDDFIIKGVNAAAERIERLPREQIVGDAASRVFPWLKGHALFEVLGGVWKTGTPERHTLAFRKDPAITEWREEYVYKLSSGEVVAIYDDVTERKTAERRQGLTNSILEALNSPNEIVHLTHRILLLLKQYTGVEAVGIRLREGEDFPYFETSGFSEDFVEKEKCLCARNAQHEIIRDSSGNPYVECMCGNVILGRTNPSFPFFTRGGSFWTNCTTELLASTSDEERQTRTRNRCNGEGYESVALIPLKAGEETIGLLQFNDRRPGVYSLDMIEHLEGIAASVGVAVLRKRAAEQLSRYRDHLEEMVEERTSELEAFSYSVSHDLRAPLRSIDGFSQALIDDCRDLLGEGGTDYLTRIRRASRRMGRLIDDLLGLSRISKAEIRSGMVDLSAIVRSVSEELKRLDPGRQIDFVIAEGIEVRGDPNLLRIAMENLLGNAVKFTRNKERTRIEFGVLSGEGGRPVYFVSDNGAGFDMAYADKLFAPFQRLHAEGEFEGTGIGLATIQRIIRRHRGKIWPESEIGKGTTFYFTIHDEEQGKTK